MGVGREREREQEGGRWWISEGMRGNRGRRWTRGVEAVPSLKRVSASATTRLNLSLPPPTVVLDALAALEALIICLVGLHAAAARSVVAFRVALWAPDPYFLHATSRLCSRVRQLRTSSILP